MKGFEFPSRGMAVWMPCQTDSEEKKEDGMALVACPECNQQVSTEAASCPHCGKQLSARGAPAPGPALFVPGGTPGPEQTVWEGRPSVALVYGKILRLII